MFIRFRKRSLSIWQDEALEVILVSNHRIGQKVQQRCIKYLGSIRLGRLDSDYRKTEFWRKVRKSLATLGLHPNQQRLIENKISEFIPMPLEMKNQVKHKVPQGLREKMKLISRRLKRVG
jgi:hypothetical protein